MSEKENLSRRAFIRNTSILAGGTVAGALGKDAKAGAGKVDTKKIVNYNEKMHYRRLGRTGLPTIQNSGKAWLLKPLRVTRTTIRKHAGWNRILK